METAKRIFGDRQINRKDFYSARDAILLNKVNTGKIIASDEVIVDNDSKKFIMGIKMMILLCHNLFNYLK